MSESIYRRDSVELLPTDGFAYSGRTHGFIPMSIFYKDETANEAEKPEVLFFQDFGVPPPSVYFKSIDEHYLLEATQADMVPVRLGDGFVVFLLKPGFSKPTEVKSRESEWIPVWPPLLHLVETEPAWRSVDFDADREARRSRQEREQLDAVIESKCELCRARLKLVLWHSERDDEQGIYKHASSWSSTRRCLAKQDHERRMTTVPDLFPPESEEVA